MFDLEWERFLPMVFPSSDQVAVFLAQFDQTLTAHRLTPVQLGCKNSNFVVDTNKGPFFLRITGTDQMNNEAAAYRAMKGRLNVPELLFHTVSDGMHLFLYQHINGTSLQRRIGADGCCAPALLEQVAHGAAVIHSTPQEATNRFDSFDVPPYKVWYEAFVSAPTTRAHLGEERCRRVLQLVTDKADFLSQIDRRKSLIHCDFRPINMLVDRNDRVYFVDWEGAWWGHTLSDMGSFFRYRTCFSNQDFARFERVYNACAADPLPQNWIELSLFRDLVNPLQLLSASHRAPVRVADLVRLVEETLTHWGY